MDKLDIVLAKLERIEQTSALAAKNILTIEDVCFLLGLSKARIYTLCSERRIPHFKQGRLFFKRSEIEAWQTANRMATQAEIDSKAAMYCHTH